MSRKENLYKRSNVIRELSKFLSDRFWSDDDIKDGFLLAALADGINSAATDIDKLVSLLAQFS